MTERTVGGPKMHKHLLKNPITRRVLSGFTLVISSLLATAVNAQMSVPAQFQVSESGAATYSIPIQVPPGTGGLEPKLALNYSSQMGNGLLGRGWSLGGLGAIARCPRTLAQDGVRGEINFDANDRYCLDGERLIAVGGADGGNGTLYRTEREAFAKIVSYGSAGSGPAWFKVWTKSGQIMSYGASADSRIEAPGKSEIKIWALSEILDTKSNRLQATYVKDSANGDFYPNRIDYGSNVVAGTSPTSAVTFQYEGRPDSVPVFQAGTRSVNTVRLKSVSVLGAANQSIAVYQIAYGVSPLNAVSRIESVRRCDGSMENCLPKVNFTWTTSVASTGFATAASGNWITNIGSPVGTVKLLDLNGDGRSDIMTPIGNGYWNVCLAAGENAFNCGTWYSNIAAAVQNVVVLDLNGDGRADIMTPVGSGYWNVCLSNGAGFDCGTWYSNNGAAVSDTLIADVNGDGRGDMLTPVGNGYWNVCVSGGTLFGCATWYTNIAASAANTVVVDLNGDGKSDLMTPVGSGYWNVCLSKGDGFVCGTWYSSNAAAVGETKFLDLNGDGKTDMLTSAGGGNWNVCLSTGTGFSCSLWTSNIAASAQNTLVGDFDGDGRMDIMTPVGNGYWNVCLSTGSSFNCSTWASGNGASAQETLLGDFNGDGKTDMTTPVGGGYWSIGLSNASSAGQLATISNGALVHDIRYGSLSSGRNYTKDSGANAAAYPIVDVQGPIDVVSFVTSSNAINGVTTTSYDYGGLKSNQTGRGLLGFRWMQIKQSESGLTSYTEYSQDWPYTGLPVLNKKMLANGGNGGVLSQTTTSYGCNDPSASS
ncbi:hypothetical protein FEE59_24985, partial [Herbaspirillum sp. RU 5E]|nr:hypothetical protein [Herbaspirillum sp. RU 5E]